MIVIVIVIGTWGGAFCSGVDATCRPGRAPSLHLLLTRLFPKGIPLLCRDGRGSLSRTVPASCLWPFQLSTLGFGVTRNSVVTLPRPLCSPVGGRVECDECIRTTWFEVVADSTQTGFEIIICWLT